MQVEQQKNIPQQGPMMGPGVLTIVEYLSTPRKSAVWAFGGPVGMLECGNAVEVFRVRGKRLCYFHTMMAVDGG